MDGLMGTSRFEYPLRERGDIFKSIIILGISPAFFTSLLTFALARLLFHELPLSFHLTISILHFGALLILLICVWVPLELTAIKLPDRVETGIVFIRNLVLLLVSFVLFPHQLFVEFIKGGQGHALQQVYCWFVWLVLIVLILIAQVNLVQNPYRDLRRTVELSGRTYAKRHRLVDMMNFFLFFLGAITFELWVLAVMGNGQYEILAFDRFTREAGRKSGEALIFTPPVDATTEKTGLVDFAKLISPFHISSLPESRIDSRKFLRQVGPSRQGPQLHHRMTKFSWFCGGALTGLILFLAAFLPNRLMHAVLIPATFHERDVQGLIFKSYRYLDHFIRAMFLKLSFLLGGGLALTIISLVLPILITGGQRLDFLARFSEADEVILVLVIFFAWFSPTALAIVHPDETFGEYFDRRVANHIMMVQNHVVIIGFGNLGKRVVDHEVAEMARIEEKERFFEVVTPDVRLESVCSKVVIVERDAKDVIYATNNQLLGPYGVVGACRSRYRSQEPDGRLIHPEKRVLVPVVIGEAVEPFIGSRVNLERASLLISTVPDDESVQAIFERALKSDLTAILNVTRADQIWYLTYRARHRRIVLVYPKHNQGSTLGLRLWATMLKVRALQPAISDSWPAVLIVGNSKANHYMLETLWAKLPGDHARKNAIIRETCAFVVTTTDEPAEHPELRGAERSAEFDQLWPATFVTGSRWPYSVSADAKEPPLDIRTRVINALDVQALESCIYASRAKILVINHDDVAKSLLMLSRCVRALERLKTRYGQQFQLPLILISTARGEDWEQLSLGDAMRFYGTLCKIHDEKLATDVSYPGQAWYDHFRHELMGESIIDSLADAEEIILGACRSFGVTDKKNKEKQFIELSACLPNRPAALANYVATLAGIEFRARTEAEITAIWNTKATMRPDCLPHLPSFQYLRNEFLDSRGTGFVLSGYASLAPILPDSPIYEAGTDDPKKLAVRVFANDGQKYIERQIDTDMLHELQSPEMIPEIWKTVPIPLPPGVPQVIDRVTGRETNACNTVGDFLKIMLDSTRDKPRYSCPGMTSCRVAAFQDYVAASNSERMHRHVNSNVDTPVDGTLMHASNYYCCSTIRMASAEEIPGPHSPFARIFCCALGNNDPGMIAMVMNALMFGLKHERLPRTGNAANDWVINIDYLKDISCQNSCFTLNRLFGTFEKKPEVETANRELELPLHTVRILPIGDCASTKLWYFYARALHRFLNDWQQQKASELQKEMPVFKFYWLDGRKVKQPPERLPSFDRQQLDYPVALVIKRKPPETSNVAPSGAAMCELCGIQPAAHDCRKLRVWI